jgi:hypothetical protein
MRTCAVGVLAFLVCSGCTGTTSGPSDDADVYRAVLQDRILKEGDGKGFFLMVDGNDPPAPPTRSPSQALAGAKPRLNPAKQ